MPCENIRFNKLHTEFSCRVGAQLAGRFHISVYLENRGRVGERGKGSNIGRSEEFDFSRSVGQQNNTDSNLALKVCKFFLNILYLIFIYNNGAGPI